MVFSAAEPREANSAVADRRGERAALAAHRQGKFWQLHDAMFADRTHLSRKTILDMAGAIGLDITEEEVLRNAVLCMLGVVEQQPENLNLLAPEPQDAIRLPAFK